MKALVLLTTCYPYGRGEEFLEAELPYLVAAFGRVVVFSFAFATEQTRSLPEGVEVYRFRDTPKAMKLSRILRTLCNREFHVEIAAARAYLQHPLSLGLRREMLFYLVNAGIKADFVARTLQERGIEPALFYSYWNNRFAVTAAMLKARYGRPAVSRTHGYDMQYHRSPWGYIPYKHYLAQHLDAVFFNTRLMQNEFTRLTGRTHGLEFAPLGVANALTANPGSTDGVLRLVSCSAMIPGKRVERIVDALAQVQGARVCWTHLGDGPGRPQLQDLAHRLLDGRSEMEYNLLGYCPHEKVLEFYRTQPIDLFVTMTETEGAPVSMMEAGAFGLPIISPAVGGVPEIVESGKNGELLPPDAVADDLARAIVRWLALPDEARRALRANAVTMQRERYDANHNYRRLSETMKSIAGSYH